MEDEKKLTIAYYVTPYELSKMSGNTNELNANFTEFLLSKSNMVGRLVLALEQYLKHTKKDW